MISSEVKGAGTVSTLEKGPVTAVIDSFGAKCLAVIFDKENQLFYDENDIGHSGIPLCFPSFGPLENNEFSHNGKVYPMKQHGFIRDMNCELAELSNVSAKYRLNESEDTLKRFPFKFEFTVTYAVLNDGLEIKMSLRNNSQEPMPVSPGVHPYFALSDPENVTVTTKASSAYNNLNNYLAEEISESEYLKILDDSDGIKTLRVYGNPDHHLPNHGLETTSITRGDWKSIEMKSDLSAFKMMAIWRKADNSPFICVEPSNIKNGLNVQPQLVNPGQYFSTEVSLHFK